MIKEPTDIRKYFVSSKNRKGKQNKIEKIVKHMIIVGIYL